MKTAEGEESKTVDACQSADGAWQLVTMVGGRSAAWWLAGALGLVSLHALAGYYRLAFSKSENIEIFVEHAAGTPWCAPRICRLRAVHGGK